MSRVSGRQGKSITWVAVAVGVGSAVVGGAASVYGSKKQADASKKGAATQLEMFNTLNQQQQPYIQSGYGALSKLNTLLGIGGPSMPAATSGGGSGAPSTPMRRPMPVMQGSTAATFGVPDGASDIPLKRILSMRAANGDTEAQRILGGF